MSHLRSIAAAIAALCLATPLIAQSTATIQDTASIGALPAAATVATSSVVVDHPTTARAPAWVNALSATPVSVSNRAVVRSADYASHGQSTALMIVGGAGLLVGAVVGGKAGSIIMVGGAVVGLYGLWNYLK